MIGDTHSEDKKQKVMCMERYRRRDDEDHMQHSQVDIERVDECGICMEMNSKIVLPNYIHVLCLKCYREWTFLETFRLPGESQKIQRVLEAFSERFYDQQSSEVFVSKDAVFIL